MSRPLIRTALAVLVVILGVTYLWLSSAKPETVQAGALVYIALLLTVAWVSKWL